MPNRSTGESDRCLVRAEQSSTNICAKEPYLLFFSSEWQQKRMVSKTTFLEYYLRTGNSHSSSSSIGQTVQKILIKTPKISYENPYFNMFFQFKIR
jgi:hypothetical protein